MRLTTLFQAGLPQAQAGALTGTILRTVTAAGANSAAATSIVNDIVEITAGADATGVRLDYMLPGDSGFVYNATANNKVLYPATGGTMNGGAADAGVTIPTLKGAFYCCIGVGVYFAIVGA